MGFPVPNGAELGGVLHVLKERENVSNPLNRRPRQTGWIIALDEAPEPPVNNGPDLHKESYQKACRLSSYALRSVSRIGRSRGTGRACAATEGQPSWPSNRMTTGSYLTPLPPLLV